MKTFLLALVLVASSLLCSLTARADSPITSTEFFVAYAGNKHVKAARQSGRMTEELATYLSSPRIPIAAKAAAVNALGWGRGHLARDYQKFLAKKHETTLEELQKNWESVLDADEIFCLGYLTVRDDYLAPQAGILILDKAAKRLPRSYTVALIAALARGQAAISSDWCQVWKEVEAVQKNKRLDKDLNKKADKIILDYVGLYKDSCTP